MFFLLRAAFWLCFVSFLLPAGGDDKSAPQNDIARGKSDTVRAVSAPAERASSVCARDLEACARGSAGWLSSLREVQQGATGLYRSVVDRVTSRDPAQGTLRSSDLEPTWRRPSPPKPL